jgi:hypothetical protein
MWGNTIVAFSGDKTKAFNRRIAEDRGENHETNWVQSRLLIARDSQLTA